MILADAPIASVPVASYYVESIIVTVTTGGRQREPIEFGWDWYKAPDPFTVSDIRTSAARLGRVGGIASGIARRR